MWSCIYMCIYIYIGMHATYIHIFTYLCMYRDRYSSGPNPKALPKLCLKVPGLRV